MSFPEFANKGKRGTCVTRLIQGKAMGTMKESYEQMEMKRLAAQRKKEKAQAIKDKERVRQQVRTGFMSDNIIPLEHRRHDLLARHFLLYAPYIVSSRGSHIGV